MAWAWSMEVYQRKELVIRNNCLGEFFISFKSRTTGFGKLRFVRHRIYISFKSRTTGFGKLRFVRHRIYFFSKDNRLRVIVNVSRPSWRKISS